MPLRRALQQQESVLEKAVHSTADKKQKQRLHGALGVYCLVYVPVCATCVGTLGGQQKGSDLLSQSNKQAVSTLMWALGTKAGSSGNARLILTAEPCLQPGALSLSLSLSLRHTQMLSHPHVHTHTKQTQLIRLKESQDRHEP